MVDDCQDGRLPYRNTLAATVDDDQDEQREGRELEGDWEDHPLPADVDVSLRYDGEPGEFVGGLIETEFRQCFFDELDIRGEVRGSYVLAVRFREVINVIRRVVLGDFNRGTVSGCAADSRSR